MDARCARPSRRTRTGGDPHRRRPCLAARDRRSRPCRRPLPPMRPARRTRPRSYTPWKQIVGQTRTLRATRGKAPPRSGPGTPATRDTGTAALAMPRETRKGQPPEWAARGCRLSQGTPALIHHGDPLAPGPQAPGSSGTPASAGLLPPHPNAARQGQQCRGRSAGPPHRPGGARGHRDCPSVSAGRRIGTGPWPLQPPTVRRWGWHPSGRTRQWGMHQGLAPAAPRWARPARAYPLSPPRRRRRVLDCDARRRLHWRFADG